LGTRQGDLHTFKREEVVTGKGWSESNRGIETGRRHGSKELLGREVYTRTVIGPKGWGKGLENRVRGGGPTVPGKNRMVEDRTPESG